MRTVAYLRVSTEDQASKGVSLDVQREKITAYADLYGLELVEIIEDAGVSAKSLDRPGLQRALGLLKEGTADALLVFKFDRLTRSVRDLGSLIETTFSPETGKPALLSVQDQIDTRSAAGRLVLERPGQRGAVGTGNHLGADHQRTGAQESDGQGLWGRALWVRSRRGRSDPQRGRVGDHRANPGVAV